LLVLMRRARALRETRRRRAHVTDGLAERARSVAAEAAADGMKEPPASDASWIRRAHGSGGATAGARFFRPADVSAALPSLVIPVASWRPP
jgi:hypothetical protein